MMTVKIIRVNGSEDEHSIAKHIAMNWIQRMLNAPQALDAVNLRDGRVMIVDDTALIDGKPENPRATAIYRSLCKPGTGGRVSGLTFATWEEADAFARSEANRSGTARGIEAPTSFESQWTVKHLPRPENRYGWECSCEAVEPAGEPGSATADYYLDPEAA